jgi:hypothetical protein
MTWHDVLSAVDAGRGTVTKLVDQGGIVAPTGKPGGLLMFHGNLVHGSAGNITPYPRKIVYLTLERGFELHPHADAEGMDRAYRFHADRADG